MKSENINESAVRQEVSDDMLRELLQRNIRQAEQNPWFTRRVMNRLPEQSAWAKVSIGQWICYLLGLIGFIFAGYWAAGWLSQSGFSLSTLMMVGFMGLLLITTAGIIMVPSLIRILREP